MVSKTRDRLIEVARQLFVYKGVENTTMNDIAAASDKGRRTIYTYFKNKTEIYNAVVEQQSNVVVERLRAVVESELPLPEKLRKYLEVRFDVLTDTTPRQPRHHSFFAREHKRGNKVQQMAIAKERELFKALLSDGVKSGVFDATQATRAQFLLTLAFNAVDYCDIHDGFSALGMNMSDARTSIVEFMTTGILKR